MKKYVLVPGGAGYIGSHTCKALALAGFTPVVFDNLSTGHGYAIKWGPFVQGDLNDRAKLDEALLTYRPSAVIHFAADAIVMESMINPGKYYRNNVGGTLSLLEAMRDHQIKKLIFSSTCALYGNPRDNPITEQHPIQPMSPYGRSKWMNEEIIRDFEKAHGLQAVILRYFNAAGADLDAEVGENHTPETHLIPSVLQVALGIKEELVVYGTDFPSKDGSAIRDYIHVLDLARAHVAALEIDAATINLGTGSGHSVLEIIQKAQHICGREIRVRIEKRRPGEPGVLTADNAKAKELLGWTPQCSDLDTLITSAWKWHQLLHQNTPLVRSALKC